MTSPKRTIITTTQLLIVCKAEFRDAMNASLVTVDSQGSTDVLNVGLRMPGDPTNTPVGYWTTWAMDDSQRSGLNQVFGQQGWRPLRGSESSVLKAGDAVPAWSTSQRWWVFDPDTVAPQDVLATLGLATFGSPDD